MRLQKNIERTARRRERRGAPLSPVVDARGRDGDQILGALMARVAGDAWQSAPHDEVSGLDRRDPGPRDPDSMRVLRFLLGRLNGS